MIRRSSVPASGARRPGAGESPLEVDPDHPIPFFFGHVEDHPVAKDPGVVDQDVESAKTVQSRLDDPFPGLHGPYGIIVPRPVPPAA